MSARALFIASVEEGAVSRVRAHPFPPSKQEMEDPNRSGGCSNLFLLFNDLLHTLGALERHSAIKSLGQHKRQHELFSLITNMAPTVMERVDEPCINKNHL